MIVKHTTRTRTRTYALMWMWKSSELNEKFHVTNDETKHRFTIEMRIKRTLAWLLFEMQTINFFRTYMMKSGRSIFWAVKMCWNIVSSLYVCEYMNSVCICGAWIYVFWFLYEMERNTVYIKWSFEWNRHKTHNENKSRRSSIYLSYYLSSCNIDWKYSTLTVEIWFKSC